MCHRGGQVVRPLLVSIAILIHMSSMDHMVESRMFWNGRAFGDGTSVQNPQQDMYAGSQEIELWPSHMEEFGSASEPDYMSSASGGQKYRLVRHALNTAEDVPQKKPLYVLAVVDPMAKLDRALAKTATMINGGEVHPETAGPEGAKYDTILKKLLWMKRNAIKRKAQHMTKRPTSIKTYVVRRRRFVLV